MCSHPSAVVANSVASSQAGVKIGDAVGATDWSVLVDPTAAVDVAAARQVPVGQSQGRPEDRRGGEQEWGEDKSITLHTDCTPPGSVAVSCHSIPQHRQMKEDVSIYWCYNCFNHGLQRGGV